MSDSVSVTDTNIGFNQVNDSTSTGNDTGSQVRSSGGTSIRVSDGENHKVSTGTNSRNVVDDTTKTSVTHGVTHSEGSDNGRSTTTVVKDGLGTTTGSSINNSKANLAFNVSFTVKVRSGMQGELPEYGVKACH